MSIENTQNIDAFGADGWTALHHAAKKGDVSEVERLLAAGANVDARTTAYALGVTRSSTLLLIATRYKHFDVIRLLLDRGADIEACDSKGYGSENTLCVFNNTAHAGGRRCSTP